MYGNNYSMFLINPFIYSTDAWTNLKSISFDGVDERLDVGTVSLLNGASNMSISLWAKMTQNTNETIFAVTGTGTSLLEFRFNSANNLVVFVRTNPDVAAYSTNVGALTLTNWNNFCIVWDGSLAAASRMKIYRNGIILNNTLSGVPATTLATFTSNSAFGSYPTGLLPLNGNIDEVGIFDYSLSQTEVTALYNSGCPNDLMSLAEAKRPEHYWRMGDDDTFPTITDIGQTGGNNGTMTNAESGDIVTDTIC